MPEAADRTMIQLSGLICMFPDQAAQQFGQQMLDLLTPLDEFTITELARTGDDRKFLVERKNARTRN